MGIKLNAQQISKAVVCFATCIVLILSLMLLSSYKAEAETVTDTLSVKLGYWGMSEDEYVEKGTYHWTELQQNLTVHEQAYSFFRDKEDGTYAVIVSSARGFYLADFLSYAGIDLSDVKNISFYTNDYAAGAFVSFTPYQLLEEPRFYYDNLASHISNEYNDAGILVGYTVDETAEMDKERVETMMALESNWATYEAGTQNTNPSFTNLSTSSRFRLLFGQSDVTDGLTNKSAKYVHTIAITIPGSPEIKGSDYAGTGKIMLSNKVGKHTVSFYVASDEAMLNTIMDKLTWSSSDETALKINNVDMGKSSQYEDAVKVTIDYEVFVEGADATINGNFMGMALSGAEVRTDEHADDKKNSSSDKKSSGGGTTSSGSDGDDDDDNRASLVAQGGKTINSNNTSSSSASSSQMYAMDLDEIMNPDEKETTIVKKDNSRKYLPPLGAGIGGILLLGGLTSAIRFRSEATWLKN